MAADAADDVAPLKCREGTAAEAPCRKRRAIPVLWSVLEGELKRRKLPQIWELPNGVGRGREEGWAAPDGGDGGDGKVTGVAAGQLASGLTASKLNGSALRQQQTADAAKAAAQFTQ